MAKREKVGGPDCRKCQHRGEVVRGNGVECRKTTATAFVPAFVPWDLATETNVACPDFHGGPRRKQVDR